MFVFCQAGLEGQDGADVIAYRALGEKELLGDSAFSREYDASHTPGSAA